MQRTWTSVGHDHNGTEDQRARLAGMFSRLSWQEFVVGMEMPMMQGLGIQAAIKELRLPKVSHIADSNEMAPYGLYGIRCHYRNGMAQVYICDEGSQLVVLASDFEPAAVAG